MILCGFENGALGPGTEATMQRQWPGPASDNLYFLYMFVLRAVNKAKPVLERLNYATGDAEQDRPGVDAGPSD